MDEMHKLFNEAHAAAQRLADELARRGYKELTLEVITAYNTIGAAHHDYTELTLDPM
jgi:hypothetical protein